jgi:hypothetical protein
MKLSPFYQFLLLVFVTLGVYYPTLFAPYNSLDDQVFVNHLLNQQGFSWPRHFSPGGTYDYYRPLLTLTFEIDKYVGGLQETFMHLVNVLVHLLNVILIWLIARRFGEFIQRPSEWLPLLAALLFALHPINTEAVNWIAGRTDLLAGTFVFISLYALLEFIDRRSLLWGAVGAIALLGGALCKETALFFVPGACFLLLCRPEQGRPAWPLRWVLPTLYGVAVSTYFFLRWGAFHTDRGLAHTAKLAAQTMGMAGTTGGGFAPTDAVDPFPWFDAVLAILKGSGFYAVKLLQPLPLNFAIHRLDAFYLIPGLVLAIVLAILVWRRRPVEWLFLVTASIAVSALFVIFTKLAWTPIAERYMYIPCGTFVIGLVYTVGARLTIPVWRRAAMVIVPLLLGASTWATTSRNIVWQDNLTLYQDAVRQSPDFAPAKNQLALAFYGHGRVDEARQLLAENVMPDSDSAAINRAAGYWEAGDYEAARAHLLRLLDKPGVQEVQILEALIKMTTGYLDEIPDESLKRSYYEDILGWLERLCTKWPNGFIYYRIGRVHLILNDRAEAKRAFAEAANRFRHDSPYYEPSAKLARDLTE